ncbi:MAG: glutamine amidotransferase [Clostridiales bacterium]|nr:MAG: glutamine amidotransferase [Clostridiales bacterium]
MELKILHLYHDIMDLYGDKGNIKTLEYRCKKRNINFIYHTSTIDDDANYEEYDLVFMGGGADKEQRIIAADLMKRKVGLKKALDSGTFFLLICGGYQLFGKYYIDSVGNKIEGLGFFDYATEKSENNKRCIGNIYIDVNLDGITFKVLGFENHGGQTYGVETDYFGTVLYGNGNHYKSKYEGFYNGYAIGTYIHGPLLPKNPELADFIIKKALEKRNKDVSLCKLNDEFENMAREELLKNLSIK